MLKAEIEWKQKHPHLQQLAQGAYPDLSKKGNTILLGIFWNGVEICRVNISTHGIKQSNTVIYLSGLLTGTWALNVLRNCKICMMEKKYKKMLYLNITTIIS